MKNLKATVIDACYNTQVRRFSNITAICEELENYEAKSCNLDEINKAINNIQKNADKSCFSFLTKYFALHRRYDENYEKLPIYDKYVQEYINAFYSTKGIKGKFKDTDKKAENAYEKFYKCMEKILEEENEGIKENEKLNFSDLDNKIWFCAKLIRIILNSSEKNLENLEFNIKDENNKNNYKLAYFKKILEQEKNEKIKKQKNN